MTKDDAIKEIDNLRNDIGSAYDDADQSPMWYALGMAIEALQERKTGKWIDHREEGYIECPLCGHLTTCWGGIEDLHYCFWCGERLTIPNTEAADPCDNDCEHCDRATCPKEDDDL